ncbi:MAG: RidA family protein [Acidobacteriia bacterium]|nr:RidA family protein [Terriglobia bacterium]
MKRTTRRSMMEATAVVALGAAPAAAQSGPPRSKDLIFLSGIGGWYPERRPKAGDVREQTRDALTIMKASLEKAGSSMEKVLKVSVALVDPEANWEPMNEEYEKFFPKRKPARSYWGATGFRRKGQLLQIDCIASVE